MTHAVVLIEADRSRCGRSAASSRGRRVAEAYSVTGEWDFVAIVRVHEHEQLASVVMNAIGELPGVVRTQTMVRSRRSRATTSRRCSPGRPMDSTACCAGAGPGALRPAPALLARA